MKNFEEWWTKHPLRDDTITADDVMAAWDAANDQAIAALEAKIAPNPEKGIDIEYANGVLQEIVEQLGKC